MSGMNDAVLYEGKYQLSQDYVRRRKRYEDEWADLAAHIVLFAFKEYVDVLYRLIILTDEKKRKSLECLKNEIEIFFRSAWYETLTAINYEWVVKEARERAMLKVLKHLERQTAKELKNEELNEEAIV